MIRGRAAKRCPGCKDRGVVPIVYGYPSEELVREAELGLVELGGCMPEDKDPRWACTKCGARWRRLRPAEATPRRSTE